MALDSINLRHNYPILPSQNRLIEQIFYKNTGISTRALQLVAAQGSQADQAVAANWLSQPGYYVEADRVVIASSAHLGIFAALLAAGLQGKTVAVEWCTYGNFKAIAAYLSIKLCSVETDSDGILPQSLESVCSKFPVSALYIMPTVHNPLGFVMPIERRNAIVRIAATHNLTVIDDNAYGFLHEAVLPNFAMLYPQNTFYVESLSKPFAPGLKAAFIICPVSKRAELTGALSAMNSNSAPLMTELTSMLIREGTLQEAIVEKRIEGRRRQQVARTVLSKLNIVAHPNSWHLWAPLPAGLNADRFTQDALIRGVEINSSSTFLAPGAQPIEAIRIGLGGTMDEERAIKGLEILKELLNGH